jgi:hypothetical protein
MSSSPPKVSLTVAMSFSRSARTETSQTETVTFSPLSAHRRRHASSSAAFRAHVRVHARTELCKFLHDRMPAQGRTTHARFVCCYQKKPVHSHVNHVSYTSNFYYVPDALAAAGDQRGGTGEAPPLFPALCSRHHFFSVYGLCYTTALKCIYSAKISCNGQCGCRTHCRFSCTHGCNTYCWFSNDRG